MTPEFTPCRLLGLYRDGRRGGDLLSHTPTDLP
jgi:hypothetical protein